MKMNVSFSSYEFIGITSESPDAETPRGTKLMQTWTSVARRYTYCVTSGTLAP